MECSPDEEESIWVEGADENITLQRTEDLWQAHRRFPDMLIPAACGDEREGEKVSARCSFSVAIRGSEERETVETVERVEQWLVGCFETCLHRFRPHGLPRVSPHSVPSSTEGQD